MNDIILKGSVIKRELFLLLISFVLANGVNVYSIIAYETSWSESYTSLGFVLILGLFFYLIVIIIRGLVFGVKKAMSTVTKN